MNILSVNSITYVIGFSGALVLGFKAKKWSDEERRKTRWQEGEIAQVLFSYPDKQYAGRLVEIDEVREHYQSEGVTLEVSTIIEDPEELKKRKAEAKVEFAEQKKQYQIAAQQYEKALAPYRGQGMYIANSYPQAPQLPVLRAVSTTHSFRINSKYLRKWEAFDPTKNNTKGGGKKMPRIFRYAWYILFLAIAWNGVIHLNDIALYFSKLIFRQ